MINKLISVIILLLCNNVAASINSQSDDESILEHNLHCYELLGHSININIYAQFHTENTLEDDSNLDCDISGSDLFSEQFDDDDDGIMHSFYINVEHLLSCFKIYRAPFCKYITRRGSDIVSNYLALLRQRNSMATCRFLVPIPEHCDSLAASIGKIYSTMYGFSDKLPINDVDLPLFNDEFFCYYGPSPLTYEGEGRIFSTIANCFISDAVRFGKNEGEGPNFGGRIGL